ncbi:MAG: DUF3025 domain-containing protein [Burkholderiales bacterium]|nr:DUF3025 domain-containing protein [Burkholderiales bacterium]
MRVPPATAPDDLAAIDWAAPWLAPWRLRGEPLSAHALVLEHAGRGEGGGVEEACAQALNGAQSSAPVRFVPQTTLPAGEAYEAFIYRTGQVPTRHGLHDFFNGLMWLHFPHTKRRLNQLQAAQIAQSGIQPVRGPTRDAITVMDENAALFVGPDALWHALVAKDWHTLFVTLRPLWAQAQLLLLGHALMEKLVYPRKPITAHVYRAQAATHLIADVDTWLAQDLSAEKLATKPFAHLPVLGVPGWWPANEDAAFYADASVFRAPRVAAGADPADAVGAGGAVMVHAQRAPFCP